jgi:ectoine hydroxylase-related dioxygenase (phytanoyl-CoA dioxygenase family)
MSGVRIEDDQVRFFHEEGYLVVKEVLSPEEVALLRGAAVADKKLDEHSFSVGDGEGGAARLALWNHPGSTIYGMIARSETVVGAMERLLGEEVYHYHSKMIMKDAKTGGAWTWHQDYGYWYHNGVIKPDLASISIAIDPSTRENGCLQIVPKSHRLGRIEHTLAGNQAGADMARVEKILERFPIEYVVLEPGDAVVFHSNLLHRSDANRSDKPRWSMICCYNVASNDPYLDEPHARYTRLQKVPDSAIVEAGRKRMEEETGDVAWMRKDNTGTSHLPRK